MATQLYVLQDHQRVNHIPKKKRDDAFEQIKCQNIKGENVRASLAICLRFTGIHLGFPTLSLQTTTKLQASS
jgi:hypothetical protein